MSHLLRALVLAAAVAAIWPISVSAQTPAPAPAARAVPVDPSTLLYPRTPAGLGPEKANPLPTGITATVMVVLAGAAGGWLLWRRLRGGAAVSGRGEHKLAIAETRSLGNRQYLVVAAYGERRYLLGVCPGKIDLISALEDGRPPVRS
jgi:flagellar protein FliO/FliZ